MRGNALRATLRPRAAMSQSSDPTVPARIIVCDFCSIVLSDSAWDFPARDIDYGEQRIGPGAPEPIEASIGAWIACDQCAAFIRSGQRGKLARRSAERFIREHPEWSALHGGYAATLTSLRELHDLFWAARAGEGTHIGAEQLALIARDLAFVRERRP